MSPASDYGVRATLGLQAQLPETGRWGAAYARDKRAVLHMGFKAFVNAFLRVPVQVVRTGRRLVLRLLAWNPCQHVFLRGVDDLHAQLQC